MYSKYRQSIIQSIIDEKLDATGVQFAGGGFELNPAGVYRVRVEPPTGVYADFL
jgi:hypothetical protein